MLEYYLLNVFLKNGSQLNVFKSISLVLSRPGHFNLDPKTRTGTDPKIPDPESDRKFTSTFWV